MKHLRPLQLLLTLGVTGITLVCCYPFIWMVFACFKSNAEIFKPHVLLPITWDTKAFALIVDNPWFNTWRALANSCWISIVQSTLSTFCGAGLGFCFVYSRHTSLRWLHLIVQVSLVMPATVMAIPLLEWIHMIKLYDSHWSIILPGSVSALAVLYFQQIFRRVPQSLTDAAQLDGADAWQCFLLVLGLSRPALLSFWFLDFIFAWHHHLIPVLMLHQEARMPLPLALRQLIDSALRSDLSLLMAASVVSLVPPAIAFGIGYRHIKSALADVLMD